MLPAVISVTLAALCAWQPCVACGGQSLPRLCRRRGGGVRRSDRSPSPPLGRSQGCLDCASAHDNHAARFRLCLPGHVVALPVSAERSGLPGASASLPPTPLSALRSACRALNPAQRLNGKALTAGGGGFRPLRLLCVRQAPCEEPVGRPGPGAHGDSSPFFSLPFPLRCCTRNNAAPPLRQAFIGLFSGWLIGSIVPVYLPVFPAIISPETIASAFAFFTMFMACTFFK